MGVQQRYMTYVSVWPAVACFVTCMFRYYFVNIFRYVHGHTYAILQEWAEKSKHKIKEAWLSVS